MIRIPRNNRVLAERKILLIDLDGTLTNTADIALKPMKDGQQQTDLSRIEIFEGAREFISEATGLGFQCIIVSDSHPKYVNTIVKEYFGKVLALSLADKPNTLKTLNFLRSQNIEISDSNCYVLGDSWLDIGRC
ncbi:HAD family hydrolase [Microcoleus sp. herbarium5]|uniref:HAD family hydrolase n=1 Tax=Microcoleus sp. herbarium5 TaxID=3055434 RepID=UPI002FCF44F8